MLEKHAFWDQLDFCKEPSRGFDGTARDLCTRLGGAAVPTAQSLPPVDAGCLSITRSFQNFCDAL